MIVYHEYWRYIYISIKCFVRVSIRLSKKFRTKPVSLSPTTYFMCWIIIKYGSKIYFQWILRQNMKLILMFIEWNILQGNGSFPTLNSVITHNIFTRVEHCENNIKDHNPYYCEWRIVLDILSETKC